MVKVCNICSVKLIYQLSLSVKNNLNFFMISGLGLGLFGDQVVVPWCGLEAGLESNGWFGARIGSEVVYSYWSDVFRLGDGFGDGW